MFTGNELAALLGWWMLFNWKENHPDPADTDRVYMLATTVSSKVLQALARRERFHFEVSQVLVPPHQSVSLDSVSHDLTLFSPVEAIGPRDKMGFGTKQTTAVGV